MVGPKKKKATKFKKEKKLAPAVVKKELQKCREPSAKDMAKFKDLKLASIVDINEREAVYIVSGSTNTPYRVTLCDAKHTCECMDHIKKKHNCKHIKLVLTSLGLSHQTKKGWRLAVQDAMPSKIVKKAGRKPSAN